MVDRVLKEQLARERKLPFDLEKLLKLAPLPRLLSRAEMQVLYTARVQQIKEAAERATVIGK
jgi:hypothetical protein